MNLCGVLHVVFKSSSQISNDARGAGISLPTRLHLVSRDSPPQAMGAAPRRPGMARRRVHMGNRGNMARRVAMGSQRMASQRLQVVTVSQRMANPRLQVVMGNLPHPPATASLPHRLAMGNRRLQAVTDSSRMARTRRRVIRLRQATRSHGRRLRRSLNERVTQG